MKQRINKVIEVDIDKTLTIIDPDNKGGYDELGCLTAKPNIKNIEAIARAYENGHIIHISTSRIEENRNATKFWLRKYNVRYHTLSMAKPDYDIIFDDKAINAEDTDLFIKATS